MQSLATVTGHCDRPLFRVRSAAESCSALNCKRLMEIQSVVLVNPSEHQVVGASAGKDSGSLLITLQSHGISLIDVSTS
jgi:hypothetical protein